MRSGALVILGLSSEDWGPCYTDNFTHAKFSAKWRGTVACPNEADLIAAETSANRIALRAVVSAKRYAVEVAGINFTHRTVPTPVSTSRDTRASMIGAYTKAKEGRWVAAPATEKPFKFGDGKFRPATTQEVIDIYLAVELHVDVCYNVEAKKLAEIDATGTTDINTGWLT